MTQKGNTSSDTVVWSWSVGNTNALMGMKRSVTNPATLMLLLITCMDCTGFKVDPPEDLVIVDPGHLGYLDITWRPPGSWINMTECTIRYQLEYFNTYTDSWTAIRTPWTSYSAQFDLMKDVRVRVYTLLNGPCTNGTLVKSASYTVLVQKPSSEGVAGTRVKDFICVFYNMEYMECKWERNQKIPASSQQNLYFWHKELERAEECPKYIISGGVKSGCNFTDTDLPRFTDINICINGSSPEGPLKPTFTTLQVQNHVKPRATGKLHLQTGPDKKLEIQWQSPVGSIPEHCLEWEVEHVQESPDGNITSNKMLTTERRLTVPPIQSCERHCFRVRSKLHKYCVDKSFWSEWNHQTCRPEMKKVGSWDMARVYVYITVTLVLTLGLGTMLKLKRARREKTQGSLLNHLFVRDSAPTMAEA